MGVVWCLFFDRNTFCPVWADELAKIVATSSTHETLRTLLDDLGAAKKKIEKIKAVVLRQAEDKGLWFISQTASEAYLQQELRELHEEIERIKP